MYDGNHFTSWTVYHLKCIILQKITPQTKDEKLQASNDQQVDFGDRRGDENNEENENELDTRAKISTRDRRPIQPCEQNIYK